MALQPRMIACGKSVATFSMVVRFLTGPAVIAATSIAIGLRGVLLHVAIVQVLNFESYITFFVIFTKSQNSNIFYLLIFLWQRTGCTSTGNCAFCVC